MKIDHIIENISSYTGVTADSRKVLPGSIFVAIKGKSYNGEEYIQEALSKGAAVVIKAAPGDDTPQVVTVENVRKTLALLASKYYASKPNHIVMVTGTNGKTSVAYFYKQIFEYLGYKSAAIGTLGVVSNYFHHATEGTLTSPDSITLNYLLSEIKATGIEHVAIEASSHGLDQYRVDYIPITAAAFTNLTQDHLDYHESMHEYFVAKLRLFSELLHDGVAVLNSDTAEYKEIAAVTKRTLSYGKNARDLKLISFHNSIIEFVYKDVTYKAQTSLNGEFQAYNLLAAIGLALCNGAQLPDILKIIPDIIAAPGRLELVGKKTNGAQIFLDYAHTPDALMNALSNLRKECKGKLHVIFGCGGNRDKDKRPIMGEIAASYADVVYVTDDNPRHEDPKQIRAEILASCPNALEFDSRATGIAEAIKALSPKDILLVAGKGHETYQIIGDDKIYFSDSEEIMRSLS